MWSAVWQDEAGGENSRAAGGGEEAGGTGEKGVRSYDSSTVRLFGTWRGWQEAAGGWQQAERWRRGARG